MQRILPSMKTTQKTCRAEHCTGPSWSLGYCPSHYMRFKRYGDPFGGTYWQDKCSIENCTNKHYAKGFCLKHYARHKKHGDPHKVLRDFDKGYFINDKG